MWLRKYLLVFITAIAVLLCLPARPARADVAPADDSELTTVGPMDAPDTKVQMMYERVAMNLQIGDFVGLSTDHDLTQVEVTADFILRNQGTVTETLQVIFPLSYLCHVNPPAYDIRPNTFTANVNGIVISTTEATTDNPCDDGYFPVTWAVFDVSFPPRKDVFIQVSYTMWHEDYNPVNTFDYILETGAGWYGPIGEADIIFRLPYPLDDDAVIHAMQGYKIKYNEIQWHLVSFEPQRGDNFSISIIEPKLWLDMVHYRQAVESEPNNPLLWYKLGDSYASIAIESKYYVSNKYFYDKAVDAFQRATHLDPQSVDFHNSLAHMYWYMCFSITSNRTIDSPPCKSFIRELDILFSIDADSPEGESLVEFTKVLIFPDFTYTPPVITWTPGPTHTPTVTPTSTKSVTYTKTPFLSSTSLPTSILPPTYTLHPTHTVPPQVSPTRRNTSTTTPTRPASATLGLTASPTSTATPAAFTPTSRPSTQPGGSNPIRIPQLVMVIAVLAGGLLAGILIGRKFPR
jgi:hypothetical protein